MTYDELIEWHKFFELRKKEEERAHENAKRNAKAGSKPPRAKPVKHKKKAE